MTVLIRNSQGSLKLDKRRLRKVTESLLTHLRLQDRDLSILFTDNRGITVMNRKCFGKDTPTNVISFSYMDGFDAEVIGDIIISVERAQEEARAGGIAFYERLFALIIHGLLHILGFEHENGGSDARRMKYREKRLLQYVTEQSTYKEIAL